MTSASSEALPLPKSGKQSAWMNHAICILLSLLLLLSAVAKTISIRELDATLTASLLVPVLLVRQAGILLLCIEYLLAIMLLVPIARRPALHAATVLVSVFAAYSLWRWRQGIAVPCHCFGVLFQLEPWQSIALNGFLLAAISFVLTTNTGLHKEIRKVTEQKQ